MKTYAILILAFSAIVEVSAQSQNDRRGFQGVVMSTTRQVISHEGQKVMKDEQPIDTQIQFTARTIVIDSETYDIMKKEFDGKGTNVFTCTKRRGTFEITYKPGVSLSVVDQSNKDIETMFVSVSEK